MDATNLPDEIKQVIGQALGLRQANVELTAELEQMGAGFELTMARLEHFMNSFVELGIITLAQQWDINLAWEKSLNTQLKKARTQIHMAQQAAEAEQRKKLVTPKQNKKLIVPGR